MTAQLDRVTTIQAQLRDMIADIEAAVGAKTAFPATSQLLKSWECLSTARKALRTLGRAGGGQ